MKSTSPFGTINWIDVWKTVRGLLITIAGFAIIVIGQTLLDLDLGQWNLIVAPFAGALIELGRRFLTNYTITKK